MTTKTTHEAIHRFASGIPLMQGDKQLIIQAALDGVKTMKPDPDAPTRYWLIEQPDLDEDDDHRVIHTTDLDVYPDAVILGEYVLKGSVQDLPMLVKRCLAHQVQILPFELPSVLRRFERFAIPDEALKTLNRDQLTLYVRGLYLSGQESAGEWSRGLEKLMDLGFQKTERSEGHRSFVSLVWPSEKAGE